MTNMHTCSHDPFPTVANYPSKSTLHLPVFLGQCHLCSPGEATPPKDIHTYARISL